MMGFHSCLMSETKDVSGDVTLSLQTKGMGTFARNIFVGNTDF